MAYIDYRQPAPENWELRLCKLPRQHAVLVTISNVFDTYYYEKKGYPSMGAAFTVKYGVGA